MSCVCVCVCGVRDDMIVTTKYALKRCANKLMVGTSGVIYRKTEHAAPNAGTAL